MLQPTLRTSNPTFNVYFLSSFGKSFDGSKRLAKFSSSHDGHKRKSLEKVVRRIGDR